MNTGARFFRVFRKTEKYSNNIPEMSKLRAREFGPDLRVQPADTDRCAHQVGRDELRRVHRSSIAHPCFRRAEMMLVSSGSWGKRGEKKEKRKTLDQEFYSRQNFAISII
ncbi:MAG: hypothetical protein SFV19_12200 [Rhodospirillaceae bacterium]|nr:hypothetical protein [Rhodospirillaceae bacterium]